MRHALIRKHPVLEFCVCIKTVYYILLFFFFFSFFSLCPWSTVIKDTVINMSMSYWIQIITTEIRNCVAENDAVWVMPFKKFYGASCCWRLRSLLWCLCDVFRALINSLVFCFSRAEMPALYWSLYILTLINIMYMRIVINSRQTFLHGTRTCNITSESLHSLTGQFLRWKHLLW